MGHLPAVRRGLMTEAETLILARRCKRAVRIHGWRGDDAEDLVSEMLVIALEGLMMGHVSTEYLYLRAWDRIDPRHHRGNQRLRRDAWMTPWGTMHWVAQRSSNPAMLATRADLWRQLLRPLTLRQCQLLWWYYVAGYTMQEIAQIDGTTESAVCHRHANICAHLRTIIERDVS